MITSNDVYNKLFDYIKSNDSMAIPDVAEDHISEPRLSDAVAFITGILSIELLNLNHSMDLNWITDFDIDEVTDVASFIYEKDNPDFLIEVYNSRNYGEYIIEWVHGEYHDYLHILIK